MKASHKQPITGETIRKANLVATFATTEPLLQKLFFNPSSKKSMPYFTEKSLILPTDLLPHPIQQNLSIISPDNKETTELSQILSWSRKEKSKTRAETLVFQAVPSKQLPINLNSYPHDITAQRAASKSGTPLSKKTTNLTIQISYTLNSRNELIIKHAYHSQHDIPLCITNGITFILPLNSYSEFHEKIITQKFFSKTLSTTKILTDTPKILSGFSYPRVLHQSTKSISATLGINLHDILQINLAPPRSPRLTITSNALYTHWTLGSTRDLTYLQLSLHSFSPSISKPHILRAQKHYEYTTLYHFT